MTSRATSNRAATPRTDGHMMKAGNTHPEIMVVHAWLAVQLEREVAALWHYATCPFDHCERCIADERLIKQIRDSQPD